MKKNLAETTVKIYISDFVVIVARSFGYAQDDKGVWDDDVRSFGYAQDDKGVWDDDMRSFGYAQDDKGVATLRMTILAANVVEKIIIFLKHLQSAVKNGIITVWTHKASVGGTTYYGMFEVRRGGQRRKRRLLL